MKQRILLLALAILTAFTVCACNNNSEQGTTPAPDQSGKPSDSENTQIRGYVFQAQGANGSVTLGADMNFSSVVKSLGETVNYFEAPSCAFEGIDKTYTYANFEVQTYPNGTVDKISTIILLNDLVTTPEGISIGSSTADMEKAYGNGYTQSNNAYVYAKDGMQLMFLVKDGQITSIQYVSTAIGG